MKKTILVSALTSFATVVVIIAVMYAFCSASNCDSCKSACKSEINEHCCEHHHKGIHKDCSKYHQKGDDKDSTYQCPHHKNEVE